MRTPCAAPRGRHHPLTKEVLAKNVSKQEHMGEGEKDSGDGRPASCSEELQQRAENCGGEREPPRDC